MKRIIFLATAILSLVALCGCRRDNPAPIIEFSPAFQSNVEFASTGGAWLFNFSSSADWRVECDEDWVVAEPNEGVAGADCSFTLRAAAEGCGEMRTTVVKVIAGGEAYEIGVLQHMKERFDIDEQDIYTIDSGGGVVEIELATNIDYEVKLPQGSNYNWIGLGDTRAMRDETLCFAVDQNSSNISRVAVVTLAYSIDGEDITRSIAIVQDAVGVAQNEITYTSEYDSVIELTTTEGFFPQFVVHLFDEGRREGRVVFNAAVKYLPVGAFMGQTDITSISLPDTIEYVDSEAFAGCTSISEIALPKSLKTIGGAIFDGCTALKSIICYNNPNQPKIAGETRLATIEDAAHWLYGSAIDTATLKADVGEAAFSGCQLTTVNFDGGDSIQKDAFKGCDKIERVNVESLETWLNTYIHSANANPLNCSDAALVDASGTTITSINTPASVDRVGGYLFTNYKHLTGDVIINDNIKSVGAECFAGCRVDNIYLGSGIYTVGRDFLSGCEAESLTINFNMPNLQKDTTSSSHWLHGLITPSVIFGDAVTTIGNLALYAMESVESITVGDNVTYIGEGAFASCSALNSVALGKGVETLGQHVMFRCKSLKSITLPASVTTIGAYAFVGSAIESIAIPEGVLSIGEYAFCDCESLTDVVCYPVVPPVLGNEYAFDWSATIYVPSEAIEDYRTAENWKLLKSSIVEM